MTVVPGFNGRELIAVGVQDKGYPAEGLRGQQDLDSFHLLDILPETLRLLRCLGIAVEELCPLEAGNTAGLSRMMVRA